MCGEGRLLEMSNRICIDICHQVCYPEVRSGELHLRFVEDLSSPGCTLVTRAALRGSSGVSQCGLS